MGRWFWNTRVEPCPIARDEDEMQGYPGYAGTEAGSWAEPSDPALYASGHGQAYGDPHADPNGAYMGAPAADDGLIFANFPQAAPAPSPHELQYVDHVDQGYPGMAMHLEPHSPPMAGHAVDGSVTGGGYPGYPGPDATLSGALTGAPQGGVRWGRTIFVIAGIVVLAFALTQWLEATDKGARKTDDRTRAAAAPTGSADDTTSDGLAEAPASSKPSTDQADRARAKRLAQQRRRKAAARRKKASAAAAGNHRAGHANAARGAGSAGAAGQANRRAGDRLPYTGASTWLLAVLGLMVLASGVLVQVKAASIGASASLVQRGPLLRPIDTFRSVRETLTSGEDLRAKLVDLVGGPARGSGFTG